MQLDELGYTRHINSAVERAKVEVASRSHTELAKVAG